MVSCSKAARGCWGLVVVMILGEINSLWAEMDVSNRNQDNHLHEGSLVMTVTYIITTVGQ